MIRPVDFHFNAETAKNNFYQKNEGDFSAYSSNDLATVEFDEFVTKLRGAGVSVLVVNDTLEPRTPDSIFPNNWISFHQDGSVGLYPMYAVNRRMERRTDIIDMLVGDFELSQVIDMTGSERQGKFLEGTGSMILDREHKIVYAALSIRTDEVALKSFCERFGYKPIVFIANQDFEGRRQPIYHTNVMMCVADKFAVLCAESIDDEIERNNVINSLESTDKEVVFITEYQKHNFAGNMLQLMNAQGEKFTVMSSSAYHSLDEDQIKQLNKYGGIIHSSLSTIEGLGGGSARCMMAEVFLNKKKK